jgi:hypothetical protein
MWLMVSDRITHLLTLVEHIAEQAYPSQQMCKMPKGLKWVQARMDWIAAKDPLFEVARKKVLQHRRLSLIDFERT